MKLDCGRLDVPTGTIQVNIVSTSQKDTEYSLRNPRKDILRLEAGQLQSLIVPNNCTVMIDALVINNKQFKVVAAHSATVIIVGFDIDLENVKVRIGKQSTFAINVRNIDNLTINGGEDSAVFIMANNIATTDDGHQSGRGRLSITGLIKTCIIYVHEGLGPMFLNLYTCAKYVYISFARTSIYYQHVASKRNIRILSSLASLYISYREGTENNNTVLDSLTTLSSTLLVAVNIKFRELKVYEPE
jgi:hypothetical protein